MIVLSEGGIMPLTSLPKGGDGDSLTPAHYSLREGEGERLFKGMIPQAKA